MRSVANGTTVTVVRQAAQTLPTYGDTTGSPTTFDVYPCVVWPVSTAELIQGQDTVTWDLNCYMPVGTDILSSDQVEIDGVLYDVVGQSQSWGGQLLKDDLGGVEVQLKAGTG